MIRRITPEEVVEAYRRTGVRPIQQHFKIRLDGDECRCGLGALMTSAEAYRIERTSTQLAPRRLGLSHAYAYGFTVGFDDYPSRCGPAGLECGGGSRSELRAGYKDGFAAANAVDDAGLSWV